MDASVVCRGIDIPPFYAGQIGSRAAARARSGLETLPMHFGQPTEGAPLAALAAARHALEHGPHGYWESEALRERIALHYKLTYGVDIAPERVLLTAGASAGLVAAFTALFAAGDRVAMARPGYPAYRNALRALGRLPVEVDCGEADGYRLSADRLSALQPPLHGVVVASPANPTGTMLDRDALASIASVCRARGIRLISDEIYHGISYDGRVAVSALEVDPEAIVINSFSKLFRMPGWRMGWMVAPLSCVPQLRNHLINFFLTPPALSQHAALAAFDELDTLRDSVSRYAAHRATLLRELPSLGLSGIAPPEGAFYLYIDVGHLTSDSLALCHRLLDDTGIALAPGIDFDVEHGGQHLRMSFAVTHVQVERALTLLRPWIASISGRGGLEAAQR